MKDMEQYINEVQSELDELNEHIWTFCAKHRGWFMFGTSHEGASPSDIVIMMWANQKHLYEKYVKHTDK